MGLLSLAKKDFKFLMFGFLLTFFCNFGQTFFIGFYNKSILSTLHLSNYDYGLLYGVASMLSAASLIWIGRLIDTVDLRFYTLWVLIGLAIACLLMAWVPSVFVLGLGIYLLRLTGQGLMPHISSTSLARYFSYDKGQAVSVSGLGMSASQVILPTIAVISTNAYGWRQSWQIYASFIIFLVIPLVLWMLKEHDTRHKNYLAEISLTQPESHVHSRFKMSVYGGLLKDVRFYIVLQALIGLPVLSTGFFFFQQKLVVAQGWNLIDLAHSYVFMALATAISSYVTGVLVDRHSSLRLMPFFLIPSIIAFILLVSVKATIFLFLGMVFLGFSQGAMYTINTTLWSDLYGNVHLGSIRSLMVSIMVFGTALAPAGFGFVLEHGVSITTLFHACSIYLLLASLLQFFIWKSSDK